MKIIFFGKTTMGVEIPIPPIMMNTAAPEGITPSADKDDSKKLDFRAQ
jgi:hypothetical protein